MAFAWIFFTILAAVTLLWSWFNLSSVYRSNLKHVLRPWDAADESNAEVGTDADAPAASVCADSAQIQSWPGIAMISPGRDEAEHLPRTLPELCEQDYPNYRVIFVDDQSSDGTPHIAAQALCDFRHLTVVRNESDPPADWVGKCWAVQLGYQTLRNVEGDAAVELLPGVTVSHSTGQRGPSPSAEPASWLCFTDADIHWDPRCLRSAMLLAQRTEADVVALFPRLTFGSATEALVQGQMMLALGLVFPFEKAMDPNHPDTLTGGAFMLVRRSLYDSIHGHEAVKDYVVEDLNLGRKLKAAGGRIRVALAPDLLWCRMYNGWADMWEGLTKNAYAGMEYKPHLAAVVLPAVLFANVLPPVYLLIALGWLAVAPSLPAGVAVVLAVLTVLLPARVMNGARKLVDLPARYAWSVPLGSAMYLAIIVASIWRYYRGGNVWKGRSYGSPQRA